MRHIVFPVNSLHWHIKRWQDGPNARELYLGRDSEPGGISSSSRVADGDLLILEVSLVDVGAGQVAVAGEALLKGPFPLAGRGVGVGKVVDEGYREVVLFLGDVLWKLSGNTMSHYFRGTQALLAERGAASR